MKARRRRPRITDAALHSLQAQEWAAHFLRMAAELEARGADLSRCRIDPPRPRSGRGS